VHPPGLFQILVIALILLLLFGRGRIGDSMGDLGKGVKRFRQGFADDEDAARLPGPHPEIVPVAEAQPSPDPTGK
jgi:sec-independent protein translocase protein TatA